MISKRFLAIPVLALAAVSAHAQVNLTGSGSLVLAGVFAAENGLQPTYTPGSSTSSIAVTASTAGVGTLSGWYFTATDPSDLGSVTYSLTITGVNANTYVAGLIQSFNYVGGTAGSTNYVTTPIFYNVEALTGSSAFTQTVTFSQDLTGYSTTAAYFEGNIQVLNAVPEPAPVAVLGVGALGLLIRRRRSK
jgi:hypothetical protein